jgi:hypothetical protein
MTEAEWLAYEDIRVAVSALHGSCVSQRKLRLFACGCCRQVWDLLNAEQRESVMVGERFADRTVTALELRDYCATLARDQVVACNHQVAAHACDAADGVLLTWHSGEVPPALQLRLLRDTLGNPFRPIAFDPSWRTSTVTALAQGMYDSRDFSAMPILADALQDVDCDNEEVLNHCRGPGPHVRGCWVVDAVLGKS